MKKLIVIDLMGTLIEADHVVRPRSQKEYPSRVVTCGRYLNELLESGREVIILTSLSHTTIEEEKIILNDIYATISDANKPLFKIILTDVNDEKKQKQIMDPIDSGTGEIEMINALAQDGKLELLADKDEAYEQIINKYKGYQISTVDDRYKSNKGFAKVLNSGGTVYVITNALASMQWNLGDYKEKAIKIRDEKGKEKLKVRPNSAWKGNYEFNRDSTFPYATSIEYIDRLTNDLPELARKSEHQMPKIPNRQEEKTIAATLRQIGNNWTFQELIKKIALIQGRNPEELWNTCQKINSELSEYYKNKIEGMEQTKILNAILNSLYGLGEISTNDLYVALCLDEKYYGISIEEIVQAYKDGNINLFGSFRAANQRILHR